MADGYYHIYNRGVEKRNIFLDEQDFGVFLSYVKEYLLPKDTQELLNRLSDSTLNYYDKEKILRLLKLNNFFGEITLLAYCLIPNHFHLLLKQRKSNSMSKLMNSLGTRYTMYFNKKYKRVGSLYQGVYKAVQVTTDEQLLHLTRYIHRQALPRGQALLGFPSSYPEYINTRKAEWVMPGEILAFFSRKSANLTYESFVKQVEDPVILKDITLEGLP